MPVLAEKTCRSAFVAQDARPPPVRKQRSTSKSAGHSEAESRRVWLFGPCGYGGSRVAVMVDSGKEVEHHSGTPTC